MFVPVRYEQEARRSVLEKRSRDIRTKWLAEEAREQAKLDAMIAREREVLAFRFLRWFAHRVF